DRDGTINEEIGYVLRPDELRLIPGAGEALRELRGLGLGLVVLTNQSPIGRGMLTVAELGEIHARLGELLAALGGRLDGIEFCPHRPDEGFRGRNPGTLMAARAAAALGFDPGEAWLVGDHGSDLRLGRAVGARTILVRPRPRGGGARAGAVGARTTLGRPGHGEEELERGAGEDADHVVADLREAAAIIRDDLFTSVEP